MNKFILTMNMPSRNGNPVHVVVCEHEAQTVDEFLDHFGEQDFFVVTEVFATHDTNVSPHKTRVALNYRHIGKIKMWSQEHRND